MTTVIACVKFGVLMSFWMPSFDAGEIQLYVSVYFTNLKLFGWNMSQEDCIIALNRWLFIKKKKNRQQKTDMP